MKKLVKSYIWSIVLYGAETLTILAVDQKHQENERTNEYIYIYTNTHTHR